ncbi:MAG: hypothetical protein HYU46_17305 [Deltaproteobacteria bacterium]|nr:hypothetical protein [Deltaproteobacteria bacterium]
MDLLVVAGEYFYLVRTLDLEGDQRGRAIVAEQDLVFLKQGREWVPIRRHSFFSL